jgi:hypothetical protein
MNAQLGDIGIRPHAAQLDTLRYRYSSKRINEPNGGSRVMLVAQLYRTTSERPLKNHPEIFLESMYIFLQTGHHENVGIDPLD